MKKNRNSTFNGFISFIKKERGYSKNTIDAYTIDIEKFNLFLIQYFDSSKIDYKKVDKWALRNFFGKEEEEGISSKSRRRRLSSIRTFFKFLIRINKITKNPALDISLPAISKNIPIIIPKESPDPKDRTGKIKIDNIQALINQPNIDYQKNKLEKKERKGAYLRMLRNTAILELFYATGIRLSELVSLNINSFNVSEMLLKVKGKGNKERLIPFGRKAMDSIFLYLKERSLSWSSDGTKPIFCGWDEKRISKRLVQLILKDYLSTILRSIDIRNPKGTSPHTMRHTFATHLLEADVDIRIIQELLGHSSISSTQIYTKVDTKKLIEIYKESHPHGS
jgi:integrase/recombinase XerC